MEALKGYVAGVAGLGGEFLQENRMWLAFSGVLLLAIVAVAAVILWKRRGTREGFQEGVPVKRAADIKIEAPPEVASPTTEPLIQQDDCDTMKKMLDALRLTEMNPKMKEFVASAQFQTIKSEAEEKFRGLDCKEYLDKIARGEIEAPKTSPDMRPEPPPAAES